MGDKDRFTRGFIGGLLVVPILLVVGCNSTPIPVEQPEPTKAEETPAAVEPAKTEEPTPLDLDPAEQWQPYPQGVKPGGNAELVPGYEPMRRGVAAMNDDLEKRLLETGLKVNTARTVVLPETAVSALPQKPYLVADTRLVYIDDFKDLNCMFRQDCDAPQQSIYTDGSFLLEGTSEDNSFFSHATTAGEPGLAAEGLYRYGYDFLWPFVGDPAVHCVSSFSIDFGPVTPLDYDGNGTPDLGFAFYGPDEVLPIVEQKDNTLTFHYVQPICARNSQGEYSYMKYFGLISAYPPREIEAQVQDINGVTYPVKSVAPDYPRTAQPGPGVGAAPPVLVWTKGMDFECVFDQDCNIDPYKDKTERIFQLAGTSGEAYNLIMVTPPGEPGTVGEELYGYLYRITLSKLIGQPETDCVNSFQVNFGPVTPLDYDYNGTLDLGFIADFENGVSPAAVEYAYDKVTFRFDPPLCSAGPGKEYGDDSLWFGLASAYPPREIEAQVQDINGVTYPVKSLAPDYPQEQTIQETVSIAPVVAEDPNAFDQAKLEELFKTEGVVLGMLVLETNAPNSLIPSGAYLERAWLDGDKGVVELIDVTSGQSVYKVDLLAQKVEGPSLITPSASIFLGSKTCLTCLWGWSICRDCFFWEPEMPFEQCEKLLGSCTQ